MDADSSYGGSDTTQDSHLGLGENHSMHDQSHVGQKNPHHDEITTAVHVISVPVPNPPTEDEPTHRYYHKNEITLPVNGDDQDQTDFQNNSDSKLPHYMATANLNINETLEHHSNLEEMSRNYKSSQKLNESPRSSTSVTLSGIDNPAFVEDGRSTFNSDLPYNNGLDASSLGPNEEPVTEAVNLELINMKPSQGVHNGVKDPCELNNGNGLTTIPLKKDDEDVRSPYDEYFVPVNEHRKYIRGEKLYVTKDNRVEKSKSKCICWTICICIVAAAVIIGILAAVGVIGNQGPLPQPVEIKGNIPQNDTAIVKGGISIPLAKEPPYTPVPSLSTVAPMPPTTDMSLLMVPNVLEYEFSIDNLQFIPDFANPNSSDFRALSDSIERLLKTNVIDPSIFMDNEPSDLKVKVMDFSPGSVIVKYRIGWKHNSRHPINQTDLQEKLLEHLKDNNLLGDYHIEKDSTVTRNVVDLCQFQNNGCEHICHFDYDVLNFTCLCPKGKTLASNGKHCIEVEENHTNTNESRQSRFNDEEDEVPHQHFNHEGIETYPEYSHEHSVQPEPTPEPSTEPHPKESPEPEPEFEEHDVKSHPQPEPEPEPEPEMEHGYQRITEPTPEPTIMPQTFRPPQMTEVSVRKIPHVGDDIEDTFIHMRQTFPPDQMGNTEQTVSPEILTETEKNIQISKHDYYYDPNILGRNRHETFHMNENNNEDEDPYEYGVGRIITPEAEVITETTEDAVPTTPELTTMTTAPTTRSKKTTPAVFKLHIHKTTHSVNSLFREPKIQELHYHRPDTMTESSMEQSELLTHEEYMSPFLPDLENDTFVNSLHSEEHLLDEHATDPHENTSTTKAPSLEFDQINRTNPFDNDTSDAMKDLGIKPEITIIINDSHESTTNPATTDEGFESGTEDFIHKNVSTNEETNTENNIMKNGLHIVEINTSTDENMENIGKTTTIKNVEKEIDTTEEIKSTEHSETTEVTDENIDITTDYMQHMTDNIEMINKETKTDISIVTEKTPNTTENNNEIVTTVTEIVENQTDKTATEAEKEMSNNSTELPENMTSHSPTETTQKITEDVTENATNNIKINNEEAPHYETIENVTDIIKEKETLRSEKMENITDNINIVPTEMSPIETVTDNNNIVEIKDVVTTSTEKTNNTLLENNATNEIIPPSENTNNLKIEALNAETTEELLSTTTLEPKQITTQPSDILNKIHSDDYIDEASKKTENINTTKVTNNVKYITTSSEDLLALETTTNLEGSTLNNLLEDTQTKTTDTQLNASTIHADIIETVTTAVNISNENEISTEITTLYPKQNESRETTINPKQYQVKETVSDVTTTETIFVPHRLTTEEPTTDENIQDDLSIVPLEAEITTVGKKERNFSFESNEIENDIFSKNSTSITQMKPVTEDFVLPKFNRCSTNQFQCSNGTSVKDGNYCIPLSNRCDSVFDCTDGSDELNCIEEGCPNNFQCGSKQCLKRHLVCDGIFNCNDGSDEANCENWKCTTNEFSCGNSNRCIPLSWKCDGRQHCQNGTDENDCINSGTCSEQFFKCSEESNCIPISWRCDGIKDCPNSEDEDEKTCSCSEDDFKCQIGGGCVPKTSRCDGIAQCADKSDEWDCLKLDHTMEENEKQILQIQTGNNTWHPICMDWTLWNTTYADMVCQNLGFTASSALESVPEPKNMSSNDSYVLKTGEYLHFVPSNISNCDQFVSITCQDYVCGSHSSFDIPSARIVGGDKTSSTQWPSLALLYNEKKNLYCTATLVTPLWAATSYSCIASHVDVHENDWLLYAGGTNKGDNTTSQTRKIREIVTHPQSKFSSFEFTNDIALLKLQTPVNVNSNVSAVCIPKDELEPRELCIVAGWGINKPGESTIQQYLHYLPVPLIDTDECNSTKYYNGKLSPDKICAGYTDSDKSPCYNDEGAPLMCFSDKTATWQLHGVLSHHGNCGSNKLPATYTAIDPNLRSWMTSTIGKQALTIS